MRNFQEHLFCRTPPGDCFWNEFTDNIYCIDIHFPVYFGAQIPFSCSFYYQNLNPRIPDFLVLFILKISGQVLKSIVSLETVVAKSAWKYPKFFITFFLHSKLNVLMKIVDLMEKTFQVHTFKYGINGINKSFPNFWRVQRDRYFGECSAVLCSWAWI